MIRLQSENANETGPINFSTVKNSNFYRKAEIYCTEKNMNLTRSARKIIEVCELNRESNAFTGNWRITAVSGLSKIY